MTQALALLVDAYRDLNARKLFWITFIISIAVIVVMALVGVSGTSLSILGYHWDLAPMDPLVLYKWGFSNLVIGIWLTWVAVALALISTGGLFPDLISGGTIDLYLSKPISRVRLFLIKYFTGLLFVSLQVAVFILGSFILFGVRAHTWQPSLFLAIPIVVCMYSYLFAFCVFFGVWTRSTIAAILLTSLLWAAFSGIQRLDSTLLKADVFVKNQIEHNKKYIASVDAELAGTKPADMQSPRYMSLSANRQMMLDREPDFEKNYSKLHIGHTITHAIKTVIPKTMETNDLLDRWLFTDAEVNASDERRSERRRDRMQETDSPLGFDQETAVESATESEDIIRHTSLWYIVGTSLLCEAVVVGFACWIFCRRDY